MSKRIFNLKSFLIIISMLSALNLYAQRERNYIYLFDCTQSMSGYGGSPDIWEQTKQYLKSDIEILSENSTVNIVPFQGKAYDVIRFERNEYKWNKINKVLDTYIQNVTNTNICSAWDSGVKLIDENKDNYLFLLTDGADNSNGSKEQSLEAVCKRIKEWCGKYKNSYAFYVMLTPAANDKNNRINQAIKESCHIEVVDPQGGHIAPFGTFNETEVNVNTLDLKPRKLTFSALGSFNAVIENDNQYFDVILDNGINNGEAKLVIKPKYSVQELNTQLPQDEDYSFDVKIKGENVNILNPIIKVNVANKPERVLYLVDEEQIDAGTSDCYDKFLFYDEKLPDTLSVDLQTEYNSEALKDNSNVGFKVSCETLKDKEYIIYYNGLACENKSFIIKTNQQAESKLSIVFNSGTPFGKHYFILTPINPINLEKINDEFISDYSLSIRAKHDNSINPLKKLLIGIVILLCALLIIWLLIIKPSLYPKIKAGALQISSPYFSRIRINGATKVVITNKAQTQSFVNKVLFGKVMYECNQEWPDEWELYPSKKSVRCILKGKYLVTPYTTTLTKNEEYVFEHLDTHKKFVVIIS